MTLGPADLALAALSLILLAATAFAGLRLWRDPALKVRESEDPLTDGAVLIADGGRITRLAADARRLLGDVLGQPLSGVLAAFLGEERAEAIEALKRLERTGEPMRLLTRDSVGRAVELSGTPHGSQLKIVLRDASLIEDRLAAAEARIAERDAALNARSLEHETLAELVASAPIIVWNRDAEGQARWSAGTIAADAGAVTAKQVVPFLSRRNPDGPPLPVDGPEKCRVEVTLRPDQTLPLHVVEIAGPGDGVLGFAVDASMASTAERTLTRFVQTMTETFAHLTVGLAIFDRNQTLALFNPALVQMWQVDASWLARRPSLREIVEALRASRRIPEVKNFHDWRSRLLALFEDTERADYEEVWHLSDGSNIRVLARPHPHGSLAFVFDDVTERMRLEQRFRHSIDLRRATLDRMDEGLAVFGPDGMLQFVNAAFHGIWGTEAEALGPAAHARDVLQLCSNASVETDVWDRMIGFITADANRRQWSTRLTLGSGRVLKVRVASLPDGASMILFSDITDSERIAAALRERNEALEAAEEMRTAVLDQISHRLRTPLNTIFGFAQLITNPRFGELNDRQVDYASGIIEAAGHLLDTIDDVTELAALQIEPLHDEAAPHLVWETLDLTRQLLQKRAIATGATLVVAEPEEGSEHLSCDMASLRQITFNMAAEALQRSGQGRQIALGARAIDHTTLEIFTSETGGEAGPPISGQRGADGLMRSLLQRMAARAGGSYELTEDPEQDTTRAICRFPGALAEPEPEADAAAGPTEPDEMDLPEDPVPDRTRDAAPDPARDGPRDPAEDPADDRG